MADRAAGVGRPPLGSGLALGAGQLEPTGRAGGHPQAGQQVQRRPLVIERQSDVLGANQDGVRLAVVMG